MREILFRGKCAKTQKFIDGSLLIRDETPDKIMTYCGNKFKIIPESIGQFTGLTDKNGNKIFEKDINQNGLVIKWNQLHNCFGWFSKKGFEKEILSDHVDDKGNNTNYYLSDIEIVGNYIDNPELLK